MNQILLKKVDKAVRLALELVHLLSFEQRKPEKEIVYKPKFSEIKKQFDELGKASELFIEPIDGKDFINIKKQYELMGMLGIPSYKEYKERLVIYASHLAHSKCMLEVFLIDLKIDPPDTFKNYVLNCISNIEMIAAYAGADLHEQYKRSKAGKGGGIASGSVGHKREKKMEIVRRAAEKYGITMGASQFRKDKKLKADFKGYVDKAIFDELGKDGETTWNRITVLLNDVLGVEESIKNKEYPEDALVEIQSLYGEVKKRLIAEIGNIMCNSDQAITPELILEITESLNIQNVKFDSTAFKKKCEDKCLSGSHKIPSVAKKNMK